MREQSRRRAAGAKSRAEYRAAMSIPGPPPWEAKGMSRATWYRRRANGTESVERSSALCPTSSPSLPHHRQRLPNTELDTETPCPQGTPPLGQPSLETGSVPIGEIRGNEHGPSLTGEGGNGHGPSLTADGPRAMGEGENADRPRLTGNGHDAAPDPEPLCACCGEPGDVLRDPLMRDRRGRLVHRTCHDRDESDWSIAMVPAAPTRATAWRTS